jgi:hypothetical protein
MISSDNNDTDDNIITKLSLESGVSVFSIEKIFESLQSYVVFQYAVNEKRIPIPYIGNIMIRYKGDIETDSGKEADIDVFFSPHKQLKRIIGQMHDIETNKSSPTEFDVFKNIRKTIKRDFKTKLAEK